FIVLHLLSYTHHPGLHSFPTRRSSDLIAAIANNTTPCSPRGVRDIEIDPSNPNIVYAASYARGVWRSSDNGTTWTQIKPSLNAADRKSTRLNSSHDQISYAVFCLKKKK